MSISKFKDQIPDPEIMNRMKSVMGEVDHYQRSAAHCLQWKELPHEQQLDRNSADNVTPIILVMAIPCTCLKDVYLQTGCLFLAILCTCLKDVYLQSHIYVYLLVNPHMCFCNPM